MKLELNFWHGTRNIWIRLQATLALSSIWCIQYNSHCLWLPKVLHKFSKRRPVSLYWWCLVQFQSYLYWAPNGANDQDSRWIVKNIWTETSPHSLIARFNEINDELGFVLRISTIENCGRRKHSIILDINIKLLMITKTGAHQNTQATS